MTDEGPIIDAEIVDNPRCDNCGGPHATMTHIEGYSAEVDDTYDPGTELIPQEHGGALLRGGRPNIVHGLGFRGSVSPELAAKAAEVREQVYKEFGDELRQLSLPTVEAFVMAYTRAVGWHNHIDEYVYGGRTRKSKGQVLRGYDAVPPYAWAEEMRANKEARAAAQDIGLDLTGRVKVLKDDAIVKSLTKDRDLATLGRQGRKLRELRKR